MIKTYDDILNEMVKEYEGKAGFSPDDASDIVIRLKVLANQIYSSLVNVDWLKNQVFPQTATGQQLDYHAEQRGITRKTAIPSSGKLEFLRNTPLSYDITIPVGTICSTPDSKSLRVLTIAEATLKAGETSVLVDSKCETGGTLGNFAAGTITVLVSPPPGITSVNNPNPFIGGANAESDGELRKRILESYRNIPNGTNSAFYRDHALKYEDIYSASAVPKSRGNGTVDVYVAGKGCTISQGLKNTIKSDFTNLREINVDVDVKDPTLVPLNFYCTVYAKEGYDLQKIISTATASINEYYSSLSIGQGIYLSNLGEVLYHIEGLSHYKFDTVRTFDRVALLTELITLNTISITGGS